LKSNNIETALRCKKKRRHEKTGLIFEEGILNWFQTNADTFKITNVE
jgi:hypothetical protein